MPAEIITMLVVGALFIVLGALIWKKEMIFLIHSYHCKRVKEDDKKPYTKLMGISTGLIGVGCVLTGAADLIAESEYSWILFGLFFAAGFIIITIAQMKYNGGFF